MGQKEGITCQTQCDGKSDHRIKPALFSDEKGFLEKSGKWSWYAVNANLKVFSKEQALESRERAKEQHGCTVNIVDAALAFTPICWYRTKGWVNWAESSRT